MELTSQIEASSQESLAQNVALRYCVTDAKVEDAVAQIAALANPVQIIAFGSWARGEQRLHSDLDLAVIVDDLSITRDMGQVRGGIHVLMSIDLLDMTLEELSHKSLFLNSVHRDIVEDGVLVYRRREAPSLGCSLVPTREELMTVKLDEVKLMLKKASSDEQALNLDGQSPQIAAFHGQQAIEKLLKAWLVALDVPPPKTHELNKLEDKLVEIGKQVPSLPVSLTAFNDYAVKWRYADIPHPERIDLKALRESVRQLREFILQQIVAVLPGVQ